MRPSLEPLLPQDKPTGSITSVPRPHGPVLKFKRLSHHAFVPTKGSEMAAGYDLKSAYDAIVPAEGKALIKTDLQIQLPSRCYGRVALRSGLAWKNFINVGAGVIDEDYRGNVGIVLFNHAKTDFHVTKGDRIAQLICERIIYPALEEETGEFEQTARGERGFGSSVST